MCQASNPRTEGEEGPKPGEKSVRSKLGTSGVGVAIGEHMGVETDEQGPLTPQCLELQSDCLRWVRGRGVGPAEPAVG